MAITNYMVFGDCCRDEVVPTDVCDICGGGGLTEMDLQSTTSDSAIKVCLECGTDCDGCGGWEASEHLNEQDDGREMCDDCVHDLSE